jgi:hypothetical protein
MPVLRIHSSVTVPGTKKEFFLLSEPEAINHVIAEIGPILSRLPETRCESAVSSSPRTLLVGQGIVRSDRAWLPWM